MNIDTQIENFILFKSQNKFNTNANFKRGIKSTKFQFLLQLYCVTQVYFQTIKSVQYIFQCLVYPNSGIFSISTTAGIKLGLSKPQVSNFLTLNGQQRLEVYIRNTLHYLLSFSDQVLFVLPFHIIYIRYRGSINILSIQIILFQYFEQIVYSA